MWSNHKILGLFNLVPQNFRRVYENDKCKLQMTEQPSNGVVNHLTTFQVIDSEQFYIFRLLFCLTILVYN